MEQETLETVLQVGWGHPDPAERTLNVMTGSERQPGERKAVHGSNLLTRILLTQANLPGALSTDGTLHIVDADDGTRWRVQGNKRE